MGDDLIIVLTTAVTAEYNGAHPIPTRKSGVPYKVVDSDADFLILSRYRKRVAKRTMSARKTNTVTLDEAIEAAPAATSETKNPARPISPDRGAMPDLRRVNPRFGTNQYYPILAHSIYGIARLVAKLVGKYTGLPLKVANREVGSAFLFLRLQRSCHWW